MKELFNRHFVFLMQGQLVSQLGSQAFTIALVFWVKQQTESASLVGTILMTSLVPGILSGPVGAAFADYYSRKSLIIICDLLSFLAVGSLFVLLTWFPEAKALTIGWFFVVSSCLSVIKSFFTPAIQAALPSLVPAKQVAGANSINQVIIQASSFFGQGFGGVLFRVLGAANLFLFDSLSYLFSALSATFIHVPQDMPERAVGLNSRMRELWAKTLEGIRLIWQDPGLRAMVITAATLNFFIAPILVLLPFYVEDYLGVPVDWYGYLVGAFGIGSLFGFVLAGVLKPDGRRRSRTVVAALLLNAALVVFFGLTPNAYVNLATLFSIGILLGYANISIITIIQLRTAPEMRGRVLGNFFTLTTGLMPIAMGISGLVLDAIGQRVDVLLWSCGLLLLAGTFFSAFNRNFIRFLSYQAPAEAYAQALERPQ